MKEPKNPIHVEEELDYILRSAAANRDPIAMDIVAELDKNDREEVFFKNKDYFRLIYPEYTSNPYRIGYVANDTSNGFYAEQLQQDSDLPYKHGRYTVAALGAFLKKFKNLRDYTDKEIEDFGEALKVRSPLSYRISGDYRDFQRAYYHKNYGPKTKLESDTLNKSCMREKRMRVFVPEFYAYICGCKILLVQDAMFRVVGRAVVWPKVFMWDGTEEHPEREVKVISRMYYTRMGVKRFMERVAQEEGYDVRIDYNQNSGFNPIDVKTGKSITMTRFMAPVHMDTRYHGGVPYIDFFNTLALYEDDQLYLKNDRNIGEDTFTEVGTCLHTDGGMSTSYSICPNCGNTFDGDSIKWLCDDCMEELHCTNAFDRLPCMEVVEIPFYGKVGACLVQDGRLKQSAEMAAILKMMTTEPKEVGEDD